MDNDLATKLSRVEGLLQGMSERFQRVEAAIDTVVSLDRAVAEQNIRYENMQKEVRELGHDIKNCEQKHQTRNDLIEVQLKSVTSDYAEYKNKTAGVLLTFKIFSGVLAAFLLYAAQWVYERAEGNRMTNIEQQHELKELRARIDNAQQLAKRGT